MMACTLVVINESYVKQCYDNIIEGYEDYLPMFVFTLVDYALHILSHVVLFPNDQMFLITCASLSYVLSYGKCMNFPFISLSFPFIITPFIPKMIIYQRIIVKNGELLILAN